MESEIVSMSTANNSSADPINSYNGRNSTHDEFKIDIHRYQLRKRKTFKLIASPKQKNSSTADHNGVVA